MRLSYLSILVFVVSWLQTNGQSLLLDSLKVKHERFEYSFIIIPANYEQLSKKFNLSEIKSTDSFTLRLWTSSMLWYNLVTFKGKSTLWDAHSYNYSGTSIKEMKRNPKISTLEFLNKLQAFSFDNFVSQYQIKDFKDNISDGIWYTLEIIRGKSYKVFQYHNPELFKDTDNKKFFEVIKLVDKYFYQ